MADAIYYTNEDIGGPGKITATSTSKGPEGLFDVLNACLVTGYGTGEDAKPGQGWTVVDNSLPLGFKLLAPDGVYYTFCRGPSQAYAYSRAFQVYMSETISDPAAYPPQGSNVRSGHHSDDYSAHAYRHWWGLTYYLRSSLHWRLFARGSQVLLAVFAGDYSSLTTDYGTTANSISWDKGNTLFLGNIKASDPMTPASGPQNSCVLGGTNSQPDTWNPSSECPGGMLYDGYTRLREPVSGAVETASLSRFYGYPPKLTGLSTYTNDLDLYPADLEFTQADVWESGRGQLGKVPGLFHMGYNSHAKLGSVLTMLGRGTGIGDTKAPVMVGDEPFYLFPTVYGSFAMCPLEKYWV
ncbi:hypothetical protein [Pseudomonas sp. RL_15y_Pfl2_60]|uniref:hypothetical protein n=1 Tax=Pseudomonas sp. RL_15y_Pfl2_60 TaxID=3088709 RepID=UPI0030DB7B9B